MLATMKATQQTKTVADLQTLSETDIATAAKNGMTVNQMKGCRVAMWDRRVVDDPDIRKVFANREASLAAFDRIAATPNDGVEFVSYTDQFVTSLKAVILAQ